MVSSPSPPPTRSVVKPPPPSPELVRLAWRAWLTCDDDDLAERLTTFHEDWPPWTDRWQLALLGALLGGLWGLLLSGLLWLLARLPGVVLLVVVGYLAVCGALGLLSRGARGEEPAMFVRRIVLLGWHLLLISLFVATFADPYVQPMPNSALMLGLIGSVVLAVLIWRATTPLLFEPDAEGIWPSVHGLYSVALRWLVLLLLLAVVAAQATPWTLICAALALPAALAPRRTDEWLRQLADSPRWPLARDIGARPWVRARAEPPAFAFEALMLERPPLADERLLVSDYSQARDDPPEALSEASARLWHAAPTKLARARAAAWCATEMWRRTETSRELGYRGYQLVDALANQQPAALDSRFWIEALDRLRGVRAAEAQAVSLLATRGPDLPIGATQAWAYLRELGWARLAAELGPGEGRTLAAAVLDLVAATESPEALSEWWRDWDSAAGRRAAAGNETRWTPVASRALDLTDAATAELREWPGAAHRLYALALRSAAARAAAAAQDPARPGAQAAIATWYEVARAYEALPAAARAEVLGAEGLWRMWAAVAEPLGDREELTRQEERLRQAGPEGPPARAT